MTGVVVGIDGSAGAIHALDWAAERTDWFGQIRPVITWTYPVWAAADPMLGAPPPVPVGDFEAEAIATAEKAVAHIPEAKRLPVVCGRGAAGPFLVETGADADLIVVGTRGRGAIADGILGSVSSHTVAHATVPVAVVPVEARLGTPERRIVIGVDGSQNGVRALDWAVRTFDDDVVIEAVHVWSHRVAAIPVPYAVPIAYSADEARTTLVTTISRALELSGRTDREIVSTLHYGDPRHVLRGVAEDADMLVLGARGHEGIAHLLLGSVATAMVHHPLVTTIVVPGSGD